jgi:hypothetical protein
LLHTATLPTRPDEALAWAQEALREKRYVVDPHLYRRLQERNITWRSAWYAIQRATTCVPYAPERGSLAGGTSWRITGADLSDETVSVGVETFLDHLGRRVLLITVF